MSDISQSLIDHKAEYRYPLIDTHTHFDAPVFDNDRGSEAKSAYENGVEHLVLVGYLYRHFDRLYKVKQSFDSQSHYKSKTQSLLHPEQGSENTNAELRAATQLERAKPEAHIALGLHPFYIEQHTEAHLQAMAKMLDAQRPLAIGEIGLDTFTAEMKEPENFAKQQQFFIAQLDMAVAHHLPVMLHIRKAHADALAILKAHAYDAKTLGGIAHSFSGGEQEAKAFVKLGFKLGVTGQITNPNAKKLRRAIEAAVAEYGIECLVIETDCPDMTPIMCQTSSDNSSAIGKNIGQSPNDEWKKGDSQGSYNQESYNRNVPANLPWVLASLSELLNVDRALLARQLWQNSIASLAQSWPYPLD